MPSAGETAPDFALKNQHGETVRLSDYRGKKVVLFAYPRAGTSGCTTQACGFRDNFAQIKTAGAVVLGISPDEPAALTKWIDKEKLGYDLLSDPDHQVLEAWGAWGEKSMYGKTYMGVIRSHWIIGADGAVLDAQVKVSPKKSIEKALKFLARSGS
ncbi:MAG: thioredoxin-dependent thiol peroxidase [Chloroflexi bacterium]|nr:thioredoxin-dependent thiol peroxidase [Chloroflexota bacterium]MCY4247663.1 thioredoxin-dependent thiol peroxidase [Chloroflexota bacterium]